MRASDLFQRLSLTHEDTILAGRDDILAYITKIGLRTAGGKVPSWTTLRRWAKQIDFPLHPGIRGRRTYRASLSSVNAITSWLLTLPKPKRANFRVDTPYWRAWRETRERERAATYRAPTPPVLPARN